LIVVVGLRSRRHPAPIVEPVLLRRKAFQATLVATVAFWGGFAALLMSSALFLTGVWQYSVLAAGLAMTPGPALSAVTAGLSGRLSAKTGSGQLAAIGAALLALATTWMALGLTAEPAYLQVFLPAQLLAGAGIGLLPPSLVAVSLDGLPPARLSTGIAVYTIFRQAGVVLGVTIWVALMGTASQAAAASYRAGWLLIVGCAVLTMVPMLTVGRLSVPDPVTT
jgi:MFS family permease